MEMWVRRGDGHSKQRSAFKDAKLGLGVGGFGVWGLGWLKFDGLRWLVS